MKDRIIIREKDQNLAFWDLEQYFGEFDTILDLSESQRERYRRQFGDQALAQGYLCAKVDYSSQNLDAEKVQAQQNLLKTKNAKN